MDNSLFSKLMFYMINFICFCMNIILICVREEIEHD